MVKRIEFVDVAKCLCIFLMIFGHSGLQGYPHDWIYSFHMPFFFLASGLFLKPDATSFGEVVKKNCRQLLVPYCFFYILTIPFGLAYIYFHRVPISPDYIWKPIVGMFYGVDHLTDTYSYFTNGPLWFLLALFWARVIFRLNKIHNYSIIGIVVGACISYCLYWTLNKYHFNIWSIAQAFILYPYLCVGYLLNRKLDIVRRIDSASLSNLILIALVTFAVVSISIPLIGSMEYGSLRMGNMPYLSFCIALAGSIMTLYISKVVSFANCKYLLKIGGGTIVYLSLHHPIMDVFKFVLSRVGLDISGENIIVCMIAAVLTIVACYPCLILLERYCPVLIGKKK